MFIKGFSDGRKYGRETVNIGIYSRVEASTIGEFSIEWLNLGDKKLHPRLDVFQDGVRVLYEDCQDLLRWLYKKADKQYTMDELCTALKEMGYEEF